MFINDYVPEEYKRGFDCSDGEHSMKIVASRVCNSKSGNQMLEVYFSVDNIAEYYIERYVAGEYFNKNITRLFDAFNIERGNFNFDMWKGKVGVGFFAHEQQEYVDSYGNLRTSNRSVLKYLVLNNNNASHQQPEKINGYSVPSVPGVPMTNVPNVPNVPNLPGVPGVNPQTAIGTPGLPPNKAVNSNGFVEDIPF